VRSDVLVIKLEGSRLKSDCLLVGPTFIYNLFNFIKMTRENMTVR